VLFEKVVSLSYLVIVPLVSLTAYEPLVENCRITVGDGNQNKSILIVGGAGGVGSVIIQLAKHYFKFGKVIATAARDETIKWCKDLGADFTINHRKVLQEELKSIGISGVDIVFNTADANHNWQACLDCLVPLGSIILITGTEMDQCNLRAAFFKRINVVMEYMFMRAQFDCEQERQGAILNEISRLIDAGTLKSIKTVSFQFLN